MVVTVADSKIRIVNANRKSLRKVVSKTNLDEKKKKTNAFLFVVAALTM